jgi:hypothetical protein
MNIFQNTQSGQGLLKDAYPVAGQVQTADKVLSERLKKLQEKREMEKAVKQDG